jgi:hypothetical protein
LRPSATVSLFLGSIATAGILAAVACGSDEGSVFAPIPPDAADVIAANPAPTGFAPPSDAEVPINFPADPIIDGTAPANSKDLFAGATFAAAGGPCLMEPEVGSMFPRNWLRPRFKWIAADALKPGADAPASPQTLFELRLHAEGQKNDLVVYTTNTAWTMPKPMWDAVRTSAAGSQMTMTVRGGTLVDGTLTNASQGSSGPISVAPVDAPGTIVYWTTASSDYFQSGKYNPVLKGFHVGDEGVRDVLHPEQVPNMADGKVKCVGCHTSTPDGTYTVSSTRTVSSGDGPTSIGFGLVDGGAGLPPYVSPSAKTMLDRVYQAAPSFSPAHFRDGDRVAVTMLRLHDGDPFDLIWTDLEAKSTAKGEGWGVFARNGDDHYPAAANVSHDGTKIVYISTETKDTSGNIVVDGELYTIPWNDRKGGSATVLSGANQAGSRQFYPAFSPDDSLVAFDRAPLRTGTTSYDDAQAEIYVIPSGGASRATRLAANDPPACSGAKSPGTYNSWPKWSPDVGTDAQGNKYFFIVFSSARNNGTKRFGARLYVTPVVVDTAGKITTYAALYLWNQPETEDNHSPAWDTLAIPDEVVK